jgi:hypothetical protein
MEKGEMAKIGGARNGKGRSGKGQNGNKPIDHSKCLSWDTLQYVLYANEVTNEVTRGQKVTNFGPCPKSGMGLTQSINRPKLAL